MSYSKLIDSKLNLAFNKLKDLAVEATFTKKHNVDFDFSTGQVTGTPELPIVTKVVVTSEKVINATEYVEILVKSKELGALTTYDAISLNASNWQLNKAIKGSGFIYVLELVKL